MKLLKISALFVAALLTASLAQAATASFVKKEVNKSGKTEYTYKYFCSSGAQGQITVVSDNDDTAKKLADVKAKTVCEE